MEGFCNSLQSPALTTVHSSLSRNGFLEKPLFHGQALKFSHKKTYPLAGKLKFLHVKAQASSTQNFSSEAAEAIPKKDDLKDEDLVFVAGATGRVGSRTVRELLKLGFRVRAGVRSSQKAESLVESVKQIKLDGDSTSEKSKPVEKLEIVECDLEKPNKIEPAIGNASVVICCIGASEKEIFDVTGPYRIDYLATKNLVEAATVAKVKHFVLLTSLGTNKIGFPAAILNLFWGVLLWKRKAEEALIASGLPYTIVRPGGMERPTDAFKETHNTTLSPEDTLFGGLVSNLQVAELIACIAKNPSLSYYKVVEVIAETTAPLTPLEDLLLKIPSKVAARVLDQPPSKSVTSEQPSIAKEKESTKANVTKEILSPYIAYEDLKPPTSPTPTAPVDQTDSKPAPEKAVISQPLSPYVAYEDLKPPTSPTPSAPSLSFSPTSVVNGPPQPATSIVNSMSPIPEAESSKSEIYHTEPKKQPLSPFTMYEDLKPPSSPTPSPP